MDADTCTCFWTDPKYWFVYYGAVEPGSQIERNPDCPVHRGPDVAAQQEVLAEIAAEADGDVNR